MTDINHPEYLPGFATRNDDGMGDEKAPNRPMTKDNADATGGHTAGPWSLDEGHGEVVIVGRPVWPCSRFGVKGEWGIARIFDLAEDEPSASDETHYNARLIAAAPDLLGALQTLCVLDVSYHDGEIRIPLADHAAALIAMRTAREAIARATGATP